MIPRDVKSPTIAIPFHRLLKVVAIVDEQDPQTGARWYAGQKRLAGRIKFHTYAVRQ